MTHRLARRGLAAWLWALVPLVPLVATAALAPALGHPPVRAALQATVPALGEPSGRAASATSAGGQLCWG